MASNHPILCQSLLLPPSVFPSTRVFSNESVLHTRWPTYWRFSFSISPSNENSGLISFRMDWFDVLAALETLKRLLQDHSWKASILWCLAFFMVQLSQLYMTTTCTCSLYMVCICTNHSFDYMQLCSKVMSLIFNIVSRFVMATVHRVTKSQTR